MILVAHSGVRCDGCNAEPIVGIRYKCGNCKGCSIVTCSLSSLELLQDYDLCGECAEKMEHNESHIFIKIKNPFYNTWLTAIYIKNVTGNCPSKSSVLCSNNRTEESIPPLVDEKDVCCMKCDEH